MFPIFLVFCFFVLFLEEVWRWEESSLKIKKLEGASPPDALGVVAFVRVAFLVLFFRFFPNSYVLCFLVLRVFLEEVWRWEESSLKIKKLEGGWGGGRSASPPNALGVVAFVRVACLVLFFRFFPCSYGKRCGGERSFLKNKKAGGGLPPQMHWVLLHLFVLHVLFCSSVFFPNSYVLCFLVLRVFLEERCGGERSHP